MSSLTGNFLKDEEDTDDDFEYEHNLVCIAMSFKQEKSDEVYQIIKNSCKNVGLKAIRVDEYISSGIVLLKIAELIENAEFLIFDLTHERQNVYYELGYAHGVGNRESDILLIALEDTKLHYDIAGLHVHFYKSPEHLKSLLEKILPEMIHQSREGPLPSR